MTLLFLPVPPVIADAEFVSDISVVQGTSITMECKTAGVPDPNITWYKEGEIIQVDQLPNFRLQQAGRVMQVGAVCLWLLWINGFLCHHFEEKAIQRDHFVYLLVCLLICHENLTLAKIFHFLFLY